MGEGTSARTGGGMASLPNLSALDDALVAPTGGAAGRRVGRWFRGESEAEKAIREFFEEHTKWDKEAHKSDKWWTQGYVNKLNEKQGDNIDKAHHYAYRMAMGSSEEYNLPECTLTVVYAGRSTLTVTQNPAEPMDETVELRMRRKVNRVTTRLQDENRDCLDGAKKTGFVELNISVNADGTFDSMSHEFQPDDGKEITLQPYIYKI